MQTRMPISWEIWDGNPRWVGEGHFDGLMNYPLKQAILDFMNRHIDAAGFQIGLKNSIVFILPRMDMLCTICWEVTTQSEF